MKLGKGASARKVEEATKAIRAKAQPTGAKKRPMGKITTPEERATAERLEKGSARKPVCGKKRSANPHGCPGFVATARTSTSKPAAAMAKLLREA